MKQHRVHLSAGWWDGVNYVAGSLLYAVGVTMFITPNDLVPGGVTGVSILIHHLIPVFPIGLGIVLINLPLFWLAWRHIGRGFTRRTAFVTLLSSVTIDLLAPWVPPYTANPLLSALFGGLLCGMGLSLIFLRGATTGGSEIVARLLEKKYPHISIGRLILAVDGGIVALSALVFGRLEATMYAAVLVYVSSQVTDEMIGGSRRTRTVLVVGNPATNLRETLTGQWHRGVTLLEAVGGYTGAARQLLLCAVRPSEVYVLRRLVRECDPDAFIIVLNSEQVMGNGFLSE